MIVQRFGILAISSLSAACIFGAPQTNAPSSARPADSTNAVAATNAVANAGANKAQTNAEPRFAVLRYDVTGNTLIPKKALDAILAKHTGTNITFDDVVSVLKELQMSYHDRGYDTVNVTIPQQKLTNGVFRIRVFEGRLAEIQVLGNDHFS